MNSNLFPIPLDTSNAKTFVGIEALMYQGENFLSALVGGIKKLKENGKFDTASIKEARLSEIANKFTGMNVTIQVENGWGAYMYMPPMDNSHPFQNNYLVDQPLFSTAGEMILKGKSDPIAELNYKDATVGGVYSQVPVNIFIGKDFFKSRFTSEEIAAILLHELGHAFTYFYYLGRMFFANFLISSYAQEIVGTRDVDRRKILIKAAERRLGTELYNPNALAEQPMLDKNKMETLFINAHRYTLANTTGTDIYDFRSCEQLADYFATMHGAGPHLISGLNKFYEMCGHDALLPFPIYLIGEFFKLVMTPLTLPISLLIILVSNPSIKRYDDPAARAKYIEMQMRSTLKNRNLDPEVRKSLLASIEAAGKHSSRLTDHKGLDHLLWTVLSPSYRRGVKQEQSQKILEGILFNDLYQKAAVFDSLEEYSPLIDETVVALVESREEALEDDVLVNFNELESDVNYLESVENEIADSGVVTDKQVVAIESILVKYGLNKQISTESFKTVSTEAWKSLALALIGATIAILIGILWKIIKWLTNGDKATSVKEKSAEVKQKVEAGSKVADAVPGNINVLKSAVSSYSDENPKATISTLDRSVALDTKSNINNSSSKTIVNTVRSNNPLNAIKPTPVPNKPKLFVYPPKQLDALGRVIDYKFMNESPSFLTMFNAHAKLDPSLTKKYGLNGNSLLNDLEDYLEFYFTKKPMEHVKTYLSQQSFSIADKELVLMNHGDLAKHINYLNQLGPVVIKNTNLLLKLVNPNYLEQFKGSFSDVGKGKIYTLKNNEAVLYTFTNVYRKVFEDNSREFKHDYFAGWISDIEALDELYSLSKNSLDVSKSPLLKDLMGGQFHQVDTTINTDISVNEVSKLVKLIETNKEKWLKDVCGTFTKVRFGERDVDKALSSENKALRNCATSAVRQYEKFIKHILNMLMNYERNIAATLAYANSINKYGNDVGNFLISSKVMLIDYMNTPG